MAMMVTILTKNICYACLVDWGYYCQATGFYIKHFVRLRRRRLPSNRVTLHTKKRLFIINTGYLMMTVIFRKFFIS
ncbi:hypothetical protein BLA29_013287 [Euroglyphus maynei]|uniref:Uncharacterized protein n=1 Tax=Euroglyphus maynei TaxID=6958 RepID=A0A1Y3B9V9_EURMA|nr:hypothetical protein BLA29_013287 [Euroglyphus maynei]